MRRLATNCVGTFTVAAKVTVPIGHVYRVRHVYIQHDTGADEAGAVLVNPKTIGGIITGSVLLVQCDAVWNGAALAYRPKGQPMDLYVDEQNYITATDANNTGRVLYDDYLL